MSPEDIKSFELMPRYVDIKFENSTKKAKIYSKLYRGLTIFKANEWEAVDQFWWEMVR